MPKFLKILAPILLVCVFTVSTHADDTSSLEGVWAGTGIQGEHTWSMRVTFTSNEVRIDYPSLECGGTWEPASIDPVPEGSAHFHERLEYGHHACIPDGFVRLRISPSGIDYEWSRSANDPVEATASLRREPD